VKVWIHSPHSPVFPGMHKYEFWWKVFFLDESPEIHLLQNSEYSWITAILWVFLCVGAHVWFKIMQDQCPLDAFILVIPVRNAAISGFSPCSHSLGQL
jgi:hypothetical protein